MTRRNWLDTRVIHHSSLKLDGTVLLIDEKDDQIEDFSKYFCCPIIFITTVKQNEKRKSYVTRTVKMMMKTKLGRVYIYDGDALREQLGLPT